jgi:tRNA U34 5-methylaminomethyl-2-thiouridine-forming methyltransferase MnmC
MKTELLITEDGSHTLYVPEIDECYHSSHGAIQESRHIFIEAGLKMCFKNEINILEIGFGTGLNAFLALIEVEKVGKKIKYTALEKFPVEMEKINNLNFAHQIESNKISLFQFMHQSEWNKEIEITPQFSLTKVECDFTSYNIESQYDIVFFDAFSPEKQAEMWTEKIFLKIYTHCNPGAILTTYCAKGIVRRALQNVGFEVERLAGPPGKREILRATKL